MGSDSISLRLEDIFLESLYLSPGYNSFIVVNTLRKILKLKMSTIVELKPFNINSVIALLSYSALVSKFQNLPLVLVSALLMVADIIFLYPNFLFLSNGVYHIPTLLKFLLLKYFTNRSLHRNLISKKVLLFLSVLGTHLL